MTSVLSIENDLPWHPRVDEANQLAGSLRASRMSVLSGPAGSGKTDLIRRGLLPLLRRRGVDREAASGLRGQLDADPSAGPASLSRAGAGGRTAEVVVLFDAWGEAPLPALLARLHEALGLAAPERPLPTDTLLRQLADWSERFDARLLVILDGFEEFLAAPPQHPDTRAFTELMLQAVTRPSLTAHFLLSLRTEAEPLLHRFRARVPGFDRHRVHLKEPLDRVWHRLSTNDADRRTRRGVPDVVVAVAAALHEAEGRLRPPRSAGALSAERPTAAVYRSIEQGLARMAPADLSQEPGVAREAGPSHGSDRTVPRGAAASMSRREARGGAQASAIARARMPPPSSPDFIVGGDRREPPSATPARPVGPVVAASVRGRWGAAVALLVVGGAVALGLLSSALDGSDPRSTGAGAEALPPTGAGPSAVHVDARPAAAAAPFEITIASDEAGDARMLAELSRTLAGVAGLALHVVPSGGWGADLEGLAGRARFGILRYDALQAARRAPGQSPLRVVTPLYTDEIVVVARVDSSLTALHQIEGKALNIGPTGSSRALTAMTLYERMFGHAMPPVQASGLEEAPALERLLRADGLDAMVVVGPDAVDWLARLDRQTARRLKLLPFDRDSTAGRRALQTYLPVSLPARDGLLALATPTLAAMSFLISDAVADPALVGRFALALCRALPSLQRDGHLKWREVQPGLHVDAGWPVSAAAEAAFDQCRDGAPPPGVGDGPTTSSANDRPRRIR